MQTRGKLLTFLRHEEGDVLFALTVAFAFALTAFFQNLGRFHSLKCRARVSSNSLITGMRMREFGEKIKRQ